MAVEKRVTVAVVCAPVERERYVAVNTESENDVLTLAVFVFVFVLVPEERAVLVRVPAKLVECDVAVPEAPYAVPVRVVACAVLVLVCAVVACVSAAESAPCVVPLLSSLSVRWCQTRLRRSSREVGGAHVCAAGTVCLCVCAA